MIDTHTHLNFKAFAEDWREVTNQVVASGINKMIVVGTDIKSSKKAVEMAEKHPALHASVGVHPHHARGIMRGIPRQSGSSSETRSARDDKARLKSVPALSNSISQLKRLLQHPRVVAVGEVGLDYYLYKKTKYESRITNKEQNNLKKLQKKLLNMQLKLAHEFKKPVIVHSREAGDEVIDFIVSLSKKNNWKLKGVFHCYEGDESNLKKVFKAGFYVSFTGNITYSTDRAKISKEVTLDRLLLETDSPFLTPEPLRGKRNTPMNVKIIAEKHASLRGVHLNEVVKITSNNAVALFGL